MVKSEKAGGFLEAWFNMTLEERDEYALKDYRSKFPEGSIEDYYQMEIIRNRSNINLFNEMKTAPRWYEIKLHIETQKMLKYYESKSSKSDHPGIRTESPKSKSELEIELLEMAESENKFWKGFPMCRVIKHFDVLTQRESKNGFPFLTTDQLISFLRRGFLNIKTEEKQKINWASGEKSFVIKRFYEFYELAVSQYGHPQKKENFILLLADCFDNWDQESIKPLFRPNKTKEQW